MCPLWGWRVCNNVCCKQIKSKMKIHLNKNLGCNSIEPEFVPQVDEERTLITMYLTKVTKPFFFPFSLRNPPNVNCSMPIPMKSCPCLNLTTLKLVTFASNQSSPLTISHLTSNYLSPRQLKHQKGELKKINNFPISNW